MKGTIIIVTLIASSMLLSCNSDKAKLKNAEEQLSLLLQDAEKSESNPRTIDVNGKTKWVSSNFDWTEGFFPGTCWYLYEYSKDTKWKEAAEKFQSKFRNQTNASTHDLGFVFGCSFGNGYRLTSNEEFKQVMIEAANTLASRFNPVVGAIKSWNTDRGWQATRGWSYPVIIDNMMNLELLFEASKLTGDPKYKNVAIAHANTTMKNHFRKDFSSYHVIDYDINTGKVLHKQTAQGYSDDSDWARGQAWGLYGFTVCYRYTKDKKYLDFACNIADFILNNPKLPEDLIPYWDYSDPKIPDALVDVSAATITASALYELDSYCSNKYKSKADIIMNSLATEKYTAAIGSNNHFVLKHSVGAFPQGNEIDVPLNYADYYYIEALLRKNSDKF